MDQTKQQLFEAAKRGEAGAFDQLVDHFHPQVNRFVRKRLGPHLAQFIDPEDVLQEAFLRSIRALERAEWQSERALFSWFCGIAANVLREQQRKLLRIELLPPDQGQELNADDTSPSHNLRRQERFARLNRSLTYLTDDQQEVIRLVRIEGMSIREVADRLGRSEKATYQVLWRAMEKLKARFGDTASMGLPDENLDFAERHEP